MSNQAKLILKHLLKYGSITQKESSDRYGILRLSARIYELRNKYEYTIVSITEKGKNRFGEPTHWTRYYLK